MSSTLIAAGYDALKHGRWQAAADAFTRALNGEARAEALLGLGQALWWLGEARGGVTRLEEAYRAFTERNEPMWAAACGLRMAFHQRAHLANPAAAEGWLARASHIIDRDGLDVLHGERLLMQSYLAADRAKAETWAREALECGRSRGDRDLELSALSQLGACLVDQGHVEDGLALLGEALAACLGRETENLETVVFANCTMMAACARCADFARAAQWVRAGHDLARRCGIPYLDVECLTVSAVVQFACGNWPAAEQLARAAIARSEAHAPAYHAAGVAVLARLRLAEGRSEEADRLLAGFEHYDVCLPVAAILQLHAGQLDGARRILTRALDRVGSGVLEAVPLIELIGEVDLASGHPEVAGAAARRLIDLGVRSNRRDARARGERLLARTLPPGPAAREAFDRALTGFTELSMPYEMARTQFLAASALRHAAPESAVLDARAALRRFDTLGAAGDADRTVALLRAMGQPAVRTGPKGLAVLTRREREVLALVGEGLSNPEIADRLFVSRKTVEHHVASVLAKLGVRTRAQAAAEAVRRLGAEGPADSATK
jgi:DNA-binding CsgD family transcriptional regulator